MRGGSDAPRGDYARGTAGKEVHAPPAAPRAGRLYRAVSWGFRAAFGRLWGMRVRGLEHVPRTGRTIVAFNHRSMIDAILVPVIAGVRPAHSIGKQELFKNPAAGKFFRAMNVIPLNRSRADFGSMRSALAILEREGCIVMAPEGTRSKTGAPLQPKAGVGFLAQQSGAPVVPCRIRNTEHWPRFSPRIELQFGPPMRFEGAAREYMREGTRAVPPVTEKDVAGRYARGAAGRENTSSRGGGSDEYQRFAERVMETIFQM